MEMTEHVLVASLREWFYDSLDITTSGKPLKQRRKEMLDSASRLWTIQAGDGGKNFARILSLLHGKDKEEFSACIFMCPMEPVPDDSYGTLQRLVGHIMHTHDHPTSSFEPAKPIILQ